MEKWHPASGSFGVFGKTYGRKEADRSKAMISEMISSIGDRRGGISQFFNEMGRISTEGSQAEYLTGLEKFLNESYDIRQEGDVRIKGRGFADAFNQDLERRKDSINRQRETFMDASVAKLNMDRLNLGRKKESELFQIDDLLRTLELEKMKY
jgi:hypothetical protein